MELGSLSPTAALIAAIRGDTVRGRGRVASVGSATRSAEVAGASHAKTTAQLERQLVELVREVPSDDLAAVRRVRPILIRQVLLWEFGQTFREHPEWSAILQRIEAALHAADPDAQQFAGLVRSLQRKG
ncbi:hypothetical protein [Xanthomonas sp. WHRI 8932A]|uniref:hypothetical protein n=1 Tax=unclassified Xanthomonas TaxID=2643310 RepID=UPI002B23C153|nr:hypothetical protein [Xanthomonas sp. WHRI 8932A]MEA9566354.1 hypothetical protein [Xanthomonas sp. WHRI 8932A]